MGYKVAVVGATGNVGREMLAILSERGFDADEVVPLASRRSMGVEVSYGNRTLKVKATENHDFSDTDICLMSAGSDISKEWSPKIAAKGCVVIDNSSCWRYDPDVPLVVPEVNADAVAGFKKNLWLIVAALVGHGVFDSFHQLVIQNPGVPIWWPGFCLSFDILAGVFLAMLLVRRSGFPTMS